jgi:peroxiredoxin
VVFSISDEEANKVKSFIAKKKISYPILLDPGRKVNDLFIIQAIPENLVYDREGKLVAQSIHMRTRNQLMEMLAEAGLN